MMFNIQIILSLIGLIFIGNSDKCWLTLPIKKKLSYNINEILIADPNWKIKHLSKIEIAIKRLVFSLIYEKINLIFEKI